MSAARRAAAGALLALLPATTWACGVCAEDKMAATYDHAVVEKALAHQRVVVFCEVKGAVQRKELQRAAAGVPGIDLRSMRTSTQPAAVSFAVDPRVESAPGAIAALQRRLGEKATLTLLKTLPSPQ